MRATRLRLTGDVADPAFLDWICHRARLLDLSGQVMAVGSGEIHVTLAGPAPLVDAMEMACSLGPVTVDVAGIVRDHPDVPAPRGGFQKCASPKNLPVF